MFSDFSVIFSYFLKEEIVYSINGVFYVHGR